MIIRKKGYSILLVCYNCLILLKGLKKLSVVIFIKYSCHTMISMRHKLRPNCILVQLWNFIQLACKYLIHSFFNYSETL